MKQIVQSLESALQVWEDSCFSIEIGSRLASKLVTTPREPAFPNDVKYERSLIENWRNYRRELLARKHPDWFFDTFGGDTQSSLADLSIFAEVLSSWSYHSRRVYSLDQDLQTLISLMSLENVSFSDIRLPFDSFAIALQEPIIEEDGNKYDFILISRVKTKQEGDRGLAVSLLRSDIKAYKRIPNLDKIMIFDKLKRGKYEAVRRWLNDKADQSMRFVFEAWVEAEEGLEKVEDVSRRIEETNRADNGYGSRYVVAWRLAIGLALYLQTLSPKSKHISEFQRVGQTNSNSASGCISDEAEVCMVSSSHVFTDQEKEVIRQSKGKPTSLLMVQFRSGHWRRPPGFGNDPDAKKSVIVKPYLAGRNLLKDGEIPLGTIRKL